MMTPAAAQEIPMSEIEVSPEQMAQRLARFRDLKPYK
jgi:hypothetical protein